MTMTAITGLMILNGDISPEMIVFGFLAAVVGIPIQIAIEAHFEKRNSKPPTKEASE
jgi:hypothetical protein